jgi:hypothetical protein
VRPSRQDTQARQVHWVLSLEDMLLVQRQDALLRLLCLSPRLRAVGSPRGSPRSGPSAAPAADAAPAATLLHHVAMASAAHATRVQEVLGLSSSNARGLAAGVPPAPPVPVVRTILLGPGPAAISAPGPADAAAGSSPPSARGGRAERSGPAPSSPNPPPGLFTSFNERSILARSSPARLPLSRIAESPPRQRPPRRL